MVPFRSLVRLATPLALSWFIAAASLAGPGYLVTGIVAKGPVGRELVAAYDALNEAPIMKDRKSRGMLLANVADGANPATHSLVVVFPSLAQSEAFSQQLFADPAWAEWQTALAQLATPAETMRFQTIRSWGEISDADISWENNAFRVANPAAFVTAVEKFMATPTGKSVPGQVHLESVYAAGASPATHAIVVGWASDAEAEAWYDEHTGGADWQAWMAAAGASSEALGTSLSRTLTAHGASLKAALGR